MGRRHPAEPRWCRETGCDMKVILARAPGRGGQSVWIALEAMDRHPESTEAVGCRVLVDGTAWRPQDLIEHFMTRWEISEEKARELVLDYPHHRPHHHATEKTS